MPKLIILGTSNAIPSLEHENTHMILMGATRTVLIDCANNPVVHLQRAGVEINKLSDLILTHFHPDHVSGLPQLLMNLWLMGRQEPLSIFGLDHTLERVEKMMNLYGWTEWPKFFPVTMHQIPDTELAVVIDNQEYRILASPVKHFIPTIGLRFEFKDSHKVVAYSCDTEPCPQVTRLATGADVLIHEASGDFPGHSSARQAGEAGRNSGAAALYLIHYPTGTFANGNPVTEARKQFAGPVKLAEDFMTLDFE
jgi:ribonuclease Z